MRAARGRVGPVVLVVCTVVGVWLGVSAPSTSPVTPPTPTTSVVGAP